VMLLCFSSVSPGKLYLKISHNFHAMTCNHPTVWHHITSALKKGHCKSGIYVWAINICVCRYVCTHAERSF
jgi:hypothetical protein